MLVLARLIEVLSRTSRTTLHENRPDIVDQFFHLILPMRRVVGGFLGGEPFHPSMTGRREDLHYDSACAEYTASPIRDPSTGLWGENTWGGGLVSNPPQETVESRIESRRDPYAEGKGL